MKQGSPTMSGCPVPVPGPGRVRGGLGAGAGRGRRSGLQPQPLPRAGVGEVAVTGAEEDDAVVQAVAATGPELDLVAHHPPATPEVRYRHVVIAPGVGEALGDLPPPPLELAAVGGWARLVGRPRRQARAVGARVEVRLHLLTRDQLGGPPEADGPVERGPGQG